MPQTVNAERDRLIYKLHNEDRMTYRAIGLRYRISAARVRQIFNRQRVNAIRDGTRKHW